MPEYDGFGRRIDDGLDPLLRANLISQRDEAWRRSALGPDFFKPADFGSSSKSSSSDSGFDWSWSSNSTSDSSSSTYTSGYSSSYTPPRELTPEEIEERRRQQQAFEENVEKSLKIIGLILIFPITISVALYLLIEDRLIMAVWEKLPRKWKLLDPEIERIRRNQNFVPATIITRLGIAGAIGTTISGIAALNVYQTKLSIDYPPTEIIEGNSGRIYDSRYLCSENESNSYADCKLITHLQYKQPDCIKLDISNDPALRPEKYTVTDLYYLGSRNRTNATLHCTGNDVWIGTNSISCNAHEVFYCNNLQTLDLLYAELLKKTPSERLNPTTEKPDNILGIGIRTIPLNDTIKIEHVIKGGPAEQAGIMAGDIITYVNGRSVSVLGYEQSITRINDQNANMVKLSLRRNGREVVTEIKKELIYRQESSPLTAQPPSSPQPFQQQVAPAVPATVTLIAAPKPQTQITTPTATPAPLAEKFLVTATNLNLREAPSTQSRIMGTFAEGSCVTVTADAAGDFVKVTTIDMDSRSVFITGYVSNDYLAARDKPDSYACRAEFRPR